MTCFACYRFPYGDSYTRLDSVRLPVRLDCMESIGEQSGFVAVPFGSGVPVLFLPDSVEVFPVPDVEIDADTEFKTEDVTDEYRTVFEKLHSAVATGRLEKVVLARCRKIRTEQDVMEMFHRACRMLPRLMVMLFSSEITGTWLVASPEILLESTGTRHHTVALAGTMPFIDGYACWTEKNREEQHVVEKYIETSLQSVCRDIVKDGPVTMRAGHLQHLRTDFRFKGASVGKIVSLLHPTPAICGMPVDSALEAIASAEKIDRSYYSGFAGPVCMDGETHLYVSIRCARVFPEKGEALLYAGGGIMSQSVCDEEWLETERKMETIGRCIAIRKM